MGEAAGDRVALSNRGEVSKWLKLGFNEERDRARVAFSSAPVVSARLGATDDSDVGLRGAGSSAGKGSVCEELVGAVVAMCDYHVIGI